MKIFTRWNDKVTYCIIVVCIIACFGISLGVWITYNINNFHYWKNITECAINKDFECLLEVANNEQWRENRIREIIALNFSIVGIFLTSLFISLYKFKYSEG